MGSTNEIFRNLISLVGKKIELGLRSTGEKLVGTVVYTMFDSFLIEINGQRRVIPFGDILSLDPIS